MQSLRLDVAQPLPEGIAAAQIGFTAIFLNPEYPQRRQLTQVPTVPILAVFAEQIIQHFSQELEPVIGRFRHFDIECIGGRILFVEGEHGKNGLQPGSLRCCPKCPTHMFLMEFLAEMVRDTVGLSDKPQERRPVMKPFHLNKIVQAIPV